MALFIYRYITWEKIVIDLKKFLVLLRKVSEGVYKNCLQACACWALASWLREVSSPFLLIVVSVETGVQIKLVT